MKKGVSVIVCFYNALDRLTDTLHSLVIQDVKDGVDWEIIAVDNHSTDSSSKIVEDFQEKYQSIVSISIIHEPIPGLSNARTAGINNSNYEYILFCDDDNRLDKNYIDTAYKLMQENSNIGMLGGKGIIDPKLELPFWFRSAEEAYAIGEQCSTEGNVTNIRGYVWGAGMVMRQTAWQKVIDTGFKKFLLTGRTSASKSLAGEDTEMCLLLQNAGYEIHYSGKLEFTHIIPASRLTWNYYKSVCKGFALAQIFAENYFLYFNNSEEGKFSKTLLASFCADIKMLFKGCLQLNYYKLIILEFVIKKPNYTLGFTKRKYFDRIVGRIKLAKELIIARLIILSIKKENKVFLS
jgi:glycosyltransferase involved in cell wall biosynthesis